MLGFLFSPVGRVSRADYWLRFFLPYLGATVLGTIVDVAAGGSVGSALVSLFYLWPNIAVSAKRYHDRGMSGWWVLWSALITFGALGVAFVGYDGIFDNLIGAWAMMAVAGYVAVFSMITFAVILYLLPSVRGPNAYGADPLAPRAPRRGWRDPAKEFPGPWTRPQA